MVHFGPKNSTSLWLWIHSKNFYKILHNEKGQYLDESIDNDLLVYRIQLTVRLFLVVLHHTSFCISKVFIYSV